MRKQVATTRRKYQKNILLRGSLIVIYLLTRILMAHYLVPHSDESIYVQYAQLIHSDRIRYFSISYDGTMFGDVKDPLQYWLSAPLITLFRNPFYSIRMVSVLFWLLGFVFGIKLYKKFDTSSWGRVVFALLFIVNAYFAYFDSIGLTEVLVYSTGAAYLYFLYGAVESFLEKGSTNRETILLAFVFLAASLFAKLSWMLFFVFGVLISLWLIYRHFCAHKKKVTLHHRIGVATIYILPVILAYLLHAICIRRDSNAGLGASIIYSLPEMLRFPFSLWWESLVSYIHTILFTSYTVRGTCSIIVISLVAGVINIATSRGSKLEARSRKLISTRLFLLILAVISILLVVVLLRDGWFVRHKGMLFIFCLMFFSFSLVQFFTRLEKHPRGHVIAWIVFSVLLALSSYQAFDGLLSDEQTRMAVQETPPGRANGSRMRDVIAELHALPPWLLVVDPQRWMPGLVIIDIAPSLLPQMTVQPFTTVFTKSLDHLDALRHQYHSPLYFLMDIDRPKRSFFAPFLSSDLCHRHITYVKSFEGQIFTGTRLILCAY